ncbi:MAG: peptide-methionine (S)-S-oxide reductase MsrA [Candidatus Doudnabacteria bacterium]|nr:peptide-methionine (S)-S-oxide reductase MsrA [Candidatus Doudnabacteria bacterium]
MSNTKIAIFGGGCFWCTEAVFQRLKGVEKVESGYAGGEMDKPSYEQVSSGSTGYAEVIKLEYDPLIIKYEDLLNVFFASHDPTTLNKQGKDIGTQYRSVVFYTDDEQRVAALRYIDQISSSGIFESPIVTEVKPIEKFYSAEDYHQNFYNTNQSYPYCTLVINPKLAKLREKFAHLLKDE